MKAVLRDAALLQELRPLEVVAYLRATGWVQQDGKEGQWSLWSKGDAFEILLPLQREFRDFALRMSEVLHVLEMAEERSQWMVFNDLMTTGSDVIRVRLVDPSLADGSMAIDEHARIAQQAREMMFSAACATLQPRAVLPSRRPVQAMDYLKGVRIGQSERGSYVLTIHSRVAPLLRSGQGGADFEEPFPRLVVQRLSLALHAMQHAAELAAVSDQGEQAFMDAIPLGMSANLCDALTGMAGSGAEHGRRVDIAFSWSRSRPPSLEVPACVSFQEDRLPFIAEAGRLLRESAPMDDFELQGPVVKLERQEGQERGRVTILGFVDEKPRKISLLLEEKDYQIAIDAHKNSQTVSCSGTLKKMGRGFELQAVRMLRADMD